MTKTIKRMEDGRIIIEGIIYDSSVNKRITVTNPETGGKIASIQMGETLYYPIGIIKEKKTKEKMATVS